MYTRECLSYTQLWPTTHTLQMSTAMQGACSPPPLRARGTDLATCDTIAVPSDPFESRHAIPRMHMPQHSMHEQQHGRQRCSPIRKAAASPAVKPAHERDERAVRSVPRGMLEQGAQGSRASRAHCSPGQKVGRMHGTAAWRGAAHSPFHRRRPRAFRIPLE